MNNNQIKEEKTLDRPPEFNYVSAVTVLSGKKKGRIFPLEGETFTIGRSRSSDLRLLDKEVSRNHAEIRYKNGGYSLHDQGSRWGTHIHGQQVAESVLKYGDHFEVAGVLLEFNLKLRSELKRRRFRVSRIIILAAVAAAIITTGTLYFLKREVKKDLGRPGGDILSQVIYHYDQGINYYNMFDRGDLKSRDKAIEEMRRVIALDPDGRTRFSISARRIIDGLEK